MDRYKVFPSGEMGMHPAGNWTPYADAQATIVALQAQLDERNKNCRDLTQAYLKCEEALGQQLTQRTAELEAANNGFAQVRKKTIERVARHGPIMGSRGEYRQGQLDVLESVRRIVQEELYGSHQITG